ncbi:hypothetical protein FOWG_05247 [Fusarium oxysporum f. sp. lycopersici MN25]|nr:hypothetical protein FOWG_05247 [Fusarium oxysporum f. sp. lycopersici MN25]
MASVNQRKTLDDERQRVGELVQPPREVSHQPPGQRHLAQLHLKIRQEDPLEQSLSNG